MVETAKFLADRLKTEGEKVISIFDKINAENWDAIIYTENETWVVKDVLSHFVSAEIGFLNLFMEIQSGGPGVSELFDIDQFNANAKNKNATAKRELLIEQFRTIRSEMISFVVSLTEDDLNKQGRHPFLGQTTLSEMIKMVYRHNQIHSRDLRNKIMID